MRRLDIIQKEDYHNILKVNPNPIIVLNYNYYHIMINKREDLINNRAELKNHLDKLIIFVNDSYLMMLELRSIEEVIEYWLKNDILEFYLEQLEIDQELEPNKIISNYERTIYLKNNQIKYIKIHIMISEVEQTDNSFMVITYEDITSKMLDKSIISFSKKLDDVIFKISKISMHACNKIDYMSDITNAIYQSFNTDFVSIFELKTESNSLLLVEGKGWKTEDIGRITIPNDPKYSIGYTLTNDSIIIVNDSDIEDRFISPMLYDNYNIKSSILVPISKKNIKFGILAIHSTVTQQYKVAEINFMESISNILGSTLDKFENDIIIDNFSLNNDTEMKDNNSYRKLKMYQKCNTAIISAKSELTLLQEISDILAKEGDYDFAWIGYCSNDFRKLVQPIAFSKGAFAKGALSIIGHEIRYDDSKYSSGITGKSIKTLMPSIDIQKIKYEENIIGNSHEQLLSSISLPLINNGKPLGALNLYSSKKSTLDYNEQILLFNIAESLSYGINSIKTKNQNNELLQRMKKDEMVILKLLIAIEKSSSIVIITDSEIKIEYVNSAFTIITGYTFDEVKGKIPEIINNDRSKKQSDNYLWESITSGNTWTGTLSEQNKNGSVYKVMTSINPVYDENHILINYVMIQQDITEMQHIQDKIIRSQKMEAIGRLSRNISHDFKNILSIVTLSIDMIEELVRENKSIDEELKAIRSTITKARDITSMLVNFTRSSVNDIEEFSPIDEINKIFSWLKPAMGVNIDLSLSSDPNKRILIGNSEKFNQTVVNIIMNSKDALLSGGFIKVETCSIVVSGNTIHADLNEKDMQEIKNMFEKKFDIDGEYFLLKIEDNGSGMSEEYLEKIFEPFWTSKPNGNGIGLAIVYGYVKSMNGLISVDSEIDHGTTFYILFPVLPNKLQYHLENNLTE